MREVPPALLLHGWMIFVGLNVVVICHAVINNMMIVQSFNNQDYLCHVCIVILEVASHLIEMAQLPYEKLFQSSSILKICSSKILSKIGTVHDISQYKLQSSSKMILSKIGLCHF